MPAKKQARGGSANGRATPKKRVAANGFKLPDPIPAGVIVSDIAKNEWIIGKSIGESIRYILYKIVIILLRNSMMGHKEWL